MGRWEEQEEEEEGEEDSLHTAYCIIPMLVHIKAFVKAKSFISITAILLRFWLNLKSSKID